MSAEAVEHHHWMYLDGDPLKPTECFIGHDGV